MIRWKNLIVLGMVACSVLMFWAQDAVVPDTGMRPEVADSPGLAAAAAARADVACEPEDERPSPGGAVVVEMGPAAVGALLH